MLEKTVMIVNSIINEDQVEALAYYTKHASKILKEHEGVLIGKYKTFSSITKESDLMNVMMMEFENDTIVNYLTNNVEYQKLVPYRDKAFSYIKISFANKI